VVIARAAPASAASASLRAAILVFCFWRLFEIYRTVLRFIVIDYIGEGYPHTTISAIRYLMYIPQYAVQIVMVFAVIYMYLTPGGFSGGGLPALASVSSYSYVSLTTLTTLGSGYTAVTEAAREWQVFESATGIVLFGLGLSTFLSGLKLRRTRGHTE
jgi:formate hydrogenlyase subunit 4